VESNPTHGNKRQVAVQLPPGLYDALYASAARRSSSVSQEIRWAVMYYVRQGMPLPD
jgi:hypothetical protein